MIWLITEVIIEPYYLERLLPKQKSSFLELESSIVRCSGQCPEIRQ
jgi:hypothetical protein